jgi:hypothetical protein
VRKTLRSAPYSTLEGALSRIAFAAVIALSLRAFAQDGGAAAKPAEPPPPADEIKRVLDYYYNGKDRGPALLDLKACLKVDGSKGSPTAFECTEEVKGPVKVNTMVHGWTAWYVPKGASYDDVELQFLHEGQVRQTLDIKLDGEGRTRTWRTQQMTKKGRWTIQVVRKGTVMGSVTVTVE